MNKLMVALLLALVGMTILSSFMEGAGGAVSTRLTGSVSSTVATLPVVSTSGFLTNDSVMIGDEIIVYTGTTAVSFTGCTRGSKGTEAAVHATDSTVYSSEISILNVALGFNVASTAATTGIFSVVMIPYKFFTISVPRIVMFDYSFFAGNMVYVQIFFQCIGVGFALTMAFWLANAAWGILRPG